WVRSGGWVPRVRPRTRAPWPWVGRTGSRTNPWHPQAQSTPLGIRVDPAFPARVLMLRGGVPAALVIVPGGAALGVYNRAVTGSAFRLPYAVYEAAYNPVPVFALWQRPGPAPEYRHETLRAFFNGWVMDQWSAQRSPGGWWRYH